MAMIDQIHGALASASLMLGVGIGATAILGNYILYSLAVLGYKRGLKRGVNHE